MLATVWLAACGDEEEEAVPVNVNFSNTSLGISEANPSAQVNIVFSRALESDAILQINVQSGSLNYGADADFTTIPEAENGLIEYAATAGESEISVTVAQGSGLNIQQDETITLTLTSQDPLVLVGNNATATITFSENFLAQSGTIELNGGGPDIPNQAFIDFSKMQQTTQDKYSWDLGFSTEAGSHAVILNSPASHMARPLETTDITAVSAADTAGFAGAMVIPQFNPAVGAIAWVDAPDGDLSQTAFGEIAATADAATVFIIKRDNGDWQKVKVYQSGEDYTVEYAAIDATDINTATISKDDAFNFTFFHFENGVVGFEPLKDSWDIMYGSFTESFNLGAPGLNIPYGFKDFIVLNRHNTRVAMVMTADMAYADFSSADINSLTFDDAIDALGESWRQGGGPTSAPSLHEDRFFVIEDSEGNYFKILFTRLTSPTGERGYPEFTFELVQ